MKKFIFAILLFASCSYYKVTKTTTIDENGKKITTIVKQYDTTKKVYNNYWNNNDYYWRDPFYYPRYNRTIIVPFRPIYRPPHKH
jgi:hypothetical protein